MDIPINLAPKYAFHNAEEIKKSKRVGCWHCQKLYAATEIRQYTDNGKTAICPFCGTDAVLPDSDLSVDMKLLENVNTFFTAKKG